MKKFDPFSYENLFYKYNLKISKDEINQTLFLLKKNVHSTEQLTTYLSLNVLNFPLLKNLKEQIIDILDQHNLLLDNNWAQLYNKENKHCVHKHYGSYYSGIIYMKGKDPSPTIFYSNLDLNKYSHKFEENTLIMFPSTILHEVERLDKDEERLIISFNTRKNMM
tara:strand:- start:36 stop:530 length:495 start_codon:yes stop_codon:yes gene_type:complete